MTSLPLYSKAQVATHNTAKSCWVTLHNRKVYDVTDFLDEHPGGAEYILEHAGQDITCIMADAMSHEHSASSYEILDESYLVGYLATAEEEAKLLSNPDHVPHVTPVGAFDSTTFVAELPPAEALSVATDYNSDYKKHKFLDLNRPLLTQVLFGNFTKDFYLDQVHRPRHYGKGSAPLFGNFLEPLSKTPWWVIPTVWLPVDAFVLAKGLSGMNFAGGMCLFGVGIFVWSLIEYCLHRFLFHLDDHLPDHSVALTVHFLLHGVHHYLPMDKYRLVMPPTLFVALCLPFYKLVFSILPFYWACCGFAGGFLGYIMYDMTHYFLHHARLPEYMQKLKKYHLEHHYKNYELGFGVTSWFWDKVFGTYLDVNSPLSKMKYE